MTKGVPLLYNVDIMNKTTNKSNKSLNTKSHERSGLTAKPLKSKTKNQVQEDDTVLNIIGTIIGMGLAAVLFFGVILPIISAPNFGAKVLFVILGGWILFLFKGFGGGV